MPSDAKKKQQQKKKEAAKARQSGKKPPQINQNKNADGKESSPVGVIQNGTNGTPISAEGKLKIVFRNRRLIKIFVIKNWTNYS